MTSIGVDAFQGCTITSVVIHSNIQRIEDGSGHIDGIWRGAFSQCSSLTYVSLPTSLTHIGGQAFFEAKFTSITLPTSLVTIAGHGFTLTPLISINLPTSLRVLGGASFVMCRSLLSIVLPTSLTYLESHAFKECTSLTQVSIPTSLSRLNIEVFYNAPLVSIRLPTSLTSIGKLQTRYKMADDLYTSRHNPTTAIFQELIRSGHLLYALAIATQAPYCTCRIVWTVVCMIV
jgi:hypothetical protein